MTTKPSLADLHNAYREWAGEPYSVSTFRRESENTSEFTSLDILCYRSEDPDHLRPENDFTFLATAGLSCQNTRGFGPCELIWQIAGNRTWEEIQELSEALAKIAVLPVYSEAVSFVPGMVLRNVHLPLFDRMDSLLITRWGIQGEEYLPQIRPPVSLLWIKALYGSEVLLLEELGEQELYLRLRREGIDWDDPERAPLRPAQTLHGGE